MIEKYCLKAKKSSKEESEEALTLLMLS
jgi:hypothetical protein